MADCEAISVCSLDVIVCVLRTAFLAIWAAKSVRTQNFMSGSPAASDADKKPPPNRCAENPPHCELVRTRQEVMAGEQIVKIL
jgi:hypothetical protein